MAFLSTLNIIGSGMTAQQTRLDVISENITNMRTTRTENGEGAYRRKVVVLESEGGKNSFRMAMDRAMRKEPRLFRNRGLLTNRGYETAGGVHVAEIREDEETEMPFVYDPSHPDANEAGYVEMPNITLIKEVADAMAASQAFNANASIYSTFKSVISRGLEISK